MKLLSAAFVGLIFVLGSTVAGAADVGGTSMESQLSGANDVLFDPTPNDDWRIIAGAGFGYSPDYPGSDDFTSNPLPLLDAEWRRTYFISTQRGVGLNYFRKRNWRAGPRFTLDQGRDSSGNKALIGMPDIDASIELGIFFESFSGPWRFKGDIRRGLSNGGHQGIVASFDAAIGSGLSESTNLIAGTFFHYADAAFSQKYFSVRSTESTATRSAYTAGAGLKDYGAYLTFVQNISDPVFVSASGRFTRLVGSAAESPLVHANFQTALSFIIGYRF